MKKLFLSGIALVALSLSALAQQATVYTLGQWSGGTNNLAASSTNTAAPTISVSEFDTVGVQVTGKAVSDPTGGTVVLYFKQSLDSTTYESTPSKTVTLTLSGTDTVTAVGDLTCPNAATLQLSHIASTNAMVVTNFVVKVRLKAPKRLSR